ncbi:MAG: phosphotransferase [Nitriliruptorales bacterium]
MEPQLPPSVLAEVCRAFRLGTPSSVTYLPDGRVNDNFLVRTDTGSYVVRRSHTRRTLESVTFEHALMGHLSRRGFPTPPLRTMIEGTSLLALDEKIYRVTTFVSGERCHSEEDVRVCARTLAFYHRLVADFGLPARPGFVPIHEELAAGLAQLPACESLRAPSASKRPLLRPTEPHPLGSADPLPPGWPSAFRKSLTTTCSRLAAVEPPPAIVVHASCRRESFVLQDGQVAAMLDYDNAHVDARTLDLAIALLSFAVVRPGKTALDLGRAAAFMAAYAVVTPIAGTELTLISWYIRARILKRALARYRHHRAVPQRSRAAKLQRATKLLQWLDEHEEAFRSAIRTEEHARG